jgi:mono/diheme cytochrome c family protein
MRLADAGLAGSRQRVRLRAFCAMAFAFAIGCALAGCGSAPGKPGPGPEVGRPGDELDFATLFKDNCAGCHGDRGKDGASIMLANPAYIAFAKDNLRDVIAKGRKGTLMPAFAKSAGGMLTDKQVDALANGIVQRWGDAKSLGGQTPPPYAAKLHGDATRGLAAYGEFCARCHGANGEGGAPNAKFDPGRSGSAKPGSLVDGSYLALFSDQYLRDVTIAGRPDQGMPDWRTDGSQPMTDQQVTDIVAWLASKRVANPGQPYAAHP